MSQGSIAIKRIMRECKEMEKRKQMFVYARPLEVSPFKNNNNNNSYKQTLTPLLCVFVFVFIYQFITTNIVCLFFRINLLRGILQLEGLLKQTMKVEFIMEVLRCPMIIQWSHHTLCFLHQVGALKSEKKFVFHSPISILSSGNQHGQFKTFW